MLTLVGTPIKFFLATLRPISLAAQDATSWAAADAGRVALSETAGAGRKPRNDTMRDGRQGDVCEVSCPAKLNLLLQILSRRDDGFHELQTLMVPVGLYDGLRVRRRTDGEIHLSCRWARGLLAAGDSEPLPEHRENLAWRAAERLRQCAGVKDGASLELVKRIPAAAGMGGASSDAAGVLWAAARVWELDWTLGQLEQVAAELGSDVPFFLRRCAAIASGRGERLQSVRLPAMQFVIVKPRQGLSTASVYGELRQDEFRGGDDAGVLVERLRAGDWRLAAATMNNDLQAPAARLSPAIETTLRALSQVGWTAGMSGSGTACFAWCRTAKEARRAARRLRARRIGEVHAAASL